MIKIKGLTMKERQDLIKKIQDYLKENNKDGLLIHEVEAVEPYFNILTDLTCSAPVLLYIPAEEKPKCVVSNLEIDAMKSTGLFEEQDVTEYSLAFPPAAKKFIGSLEGKKLLMNFSEGNAAVDQVPHGFFKAYLDKVDVESAEKLWDTLDVKPEIREYVFDSSLKARKKRVKQVKSKFPKSFKRGYLMVNGIGKKASQTFASYLSGFSKKHKYAVAIKSGKVAAVVHKSEKLRRHPFDKVYKYKTVEDFKKILSKFFKDAKEVYCDPEMNEGTYRVVNNTLEDKIANTPMDLIGEVFSSKLPEELKEIEKACKINAEIFDYLESVLKKGMTEQQVAKLVEEKAFSYPEVIELSFPTLVAAGENGAKIHHHASDYMIKEDDLLLVDMGIRLKSGFCSDTTCMFYFGDKIPRRVKKYNKVMDKAIKAAVKKIGPGMSRMDVDLATRAIIDKHYPTHIHGSGHPIGIKVHGVGHPIQAKPTGRLGIGDPSSIEPGIYIKPEDLSTKYTRVEGFRKEILVVVTKNGVKLLSEIPKLRLITR